MNKRRVGRAADDSARRFNTADALGSSNALPIPDAAPSCDASALPRTSRRKLRGTSRVRRHTEKRCRRRDATQRGCIAVKKKKKRAITQEYRKLRGKKKKRRPRRLCTRELSFVFLQHMHKKIIIITIVLLVFRCCINMQRVVIRRKSRRRLFVTHSHDCRVFKAWQHYIFVADRSTTSEQKKKKQTWKSSLLFC